MTKRTLLIDSDIPIYKAASISEQTFDWDGGAKSTTLDEAKAILELTQWVISIQDKLDADNIVMALGCKNGTNWRKEILPSYKSNRTSKDKPQLLGMLREFTEKTWNTYSRPTLEGDDVLGILSTSPDIIKGEKIIVSIDKDFHCIPGLLYNPNKPELKVQRISHDKADYYHAYQTLIGDSTDNYKGCPGVGPKKAQKILQELDKKDYWKAIVEAFEAKGLTEEDALVQARVARICRDSDYDRVNKRVILWNPPKDQLSIIPHNSDGEKVSHDN